MTQRVGTCRELHRLRRAQPHPGQLGPPPPCKHRSPGQPLPALVDRASVLIVVQITHPPRNTMPGEEVKPAESASPVQRVEKLEGEFALCCLCAFVSGQLANTCTMCFQTAQIKSADMV